MSDTPKQTNPQPETAPQERPVKSRASQDRKRQRSVIFYISIMFIAAFALLSLSLAMERRQHSEDLDDLNQSLSGLKDSVSAMQSVDQLYKENAALKEQLQEMTTLRDQQVTNLLALTQELERTEAAMDHFWQINEYFVRSRWSTARELCEIMEDSTQGYALKDYLPKESTTDNGRFSPADRYQEIYAELF